ncbi:ATP-binding protein [Metabacillus litoralis]|uniref:ATP-binding protein n=1 Tax=Metabacillus litoralis TaxID=152268 RepID=A0A5C6W2H4_9BACI|nr:ATP-binding protein [Metabacillus litoralis]TXC91097.1 ATP-binding protein [Metabacillus litoralis]
MFKWDVQLPCDLDEIESFDDALRDKFEEYSCSLQEHICFITHELLVNSFEATINKYGDDAHQYNLYAEVEMKEDEYIIQISDECGGVPQEALTYDLEDFLHNERGRGLLLIKELVDSISFHREHEEELYTVLVKKKRSG